ncbi:MAG: YceD family protein [Actinomycetota bacterium]
MNHSIKIDVSELLTRPGDSDEVVLDVTLDGLELPMGKIVDGAVHIDLSLESLVEGVLASGSLSGTYELVCSRCSREFTDPFSIEVNEIYAYAESEDVEEGFVIEDDSIDLTTMVSDETLLGIPSNPLHDEMCKGLCPVCGQDLNEGDCGHRRQSGDIRWEPLRALREDLSESQN